MNATKALHVCKHACFIGLLFSALVSFFFWFSIRNLQLNVDSHSGDAGSFSILSLESDRDAVWYYAPEARSFYKDFSLSGDPHTEASHGRFMPMPYLGKVITGAALLLFGGDINRTYIALGILLPGVNFLLFFLTLYYLTRSKILSLAISFFLLFFPHFPISIISDMEHLNHLGQSSFLSEITRSYSENRFIFARLNSPLITTPFLIVALAFLVWGTFRPGAKRLFGVGLIVGLISESYLYHWIALIIGAHIFLLASITMKRAKPFECFLFSLGSIFGSLPFLLKVIISKNTSWYSDFKYRIGVEEGHSWFSAYNSKFIVFLIVSALLFCLFLTLKDHWKKHLALWCSSFWLFPIAAFNLQVITGYTAHSDHVLRYAVSPILGLTCGIILFLLTEHMTARWKYVQIAITCILIGSIFFPLRFAAGTVNKFPEKKWPSYMLSRQEKQLIDFIKQECAERKVVALALDEKTNFYINTFTNASLFVPPGSAAISNDQLLQRYFTTCKFAGLDEKWVRDNMAPGSGNLHIYLFVNYYYSRKVGSSIFPSTPPRIMPESDLQIYLQRYSETSAESIDIKDREYKYILIISPNIVQHFDEERITSRGHKLVFDSESYKCYLLDTALAKR